MSSPTRVIIPHCDVSIPQLLTPAKNESSVLYIKFCIMKYERGCIKENSVITEQVPGERK